MNEPLKPDTNASLTPLVRQFTRLARLAAADPLRLLPLARLTQLAALGAPIAALLDVAPFERLREALAGPAAARRGNVARGRPQPLSDRDAAVRTRPAASAATPPSGEPASDLAVPTAARPVTSPRPTGPRSSAPQPPGRESASMTTLAERRAALRRVSAEPSRTQSTPADLAHPNTGNGVSTAPSSAHELNLPEARERNDDALDQVRHEEPATSFPARVLHEGAHEPAPSDERAIAAGQSDVVFPPAGPASVDGPVGAQHQSTPHHARLDREASAPSAVGSPRSGALSALVARDMPQADANAGKRPPGSEPTTELELADALFETLYREGVDLSWP